MIIIYDNILDSYKISPQDEKVIVAREEEFVEEKKEVQSLQLWPSSQ